MYTYLSLELFYDRIWNSIPFYLFPLVVSYACTNCRWQQLEKSQINMAIEELENTLQQVCFLRSVTCCDYWNWFHSPGFWLKTKFYIVLMTKIFCSIYWKFSKLFDALKCQLFKHSKKKSNRWYKAVIIILPVLPPPQKYPWFEETSGNVSIISNWKLKLYIKYSHISKFSRYKSMPSKPDDIEICGNV